MYEANACLISDGAETLVMQSVDHVSPERDGLKLVNLFGKQTFLLAGILSLSLVDHNVYLKELDR